MMNGHVVRQMNDPCLDPAALHARPVGEVWGMWLQLGRELVTRSATPALHWRQRSWERRMLSQMGERELHDIGLTPQAARWEINKPFWKP